MIQRLTEQISVFRDDIYPYLGGGNKARKMMALHKKIKKESINAIVTTGGIQSNHCRATALYCKKNNIDCTLVLHGDKERMFSESGNAKIIRESSASMIFCEPCEISNNMDRAIINYKESGLTPLYLQGGGHTFEGGDCYITELEKLVDSGYIPDHIFLPTGSGTTQAGILAGIAKRELNINVIGISVGRCTHSAQNTINNFFKELCQNHNISGQHTEIIVDDTYLNGGYEKYDSEVKEFADRSLEDYGIALDTTYTAKAFRGMLKIIEERQIKGEVLFWYTGGIYNYLSL